MDLKQLSRFALFALIFSCLLETLILAKKFEEPSRDSTEVKIGRATLDEIVGTWQEILLRPDADPDLKQYALEVLRETFMRFGR
jgi:hypothetical protein